MDLKNLLGKLDIIEGTMTSAEKNPTGPKFTGQWRGTDKGTPGKKLVGDSILKDLSKGKTPKSKEQELSEEFQAFLEAEFKDTVDKRPARKNARPARGHEPQPGYKTVKTENWPQLVEFTPEIVNLLKSKGYKGPYKLNTVKKLYKELNGSNGIGGNDLIMIKGDSFVIPAGSEFLVGAEGQVGPATAKQLVRHLSEGVPYKATNEYPALKDPVVAKVVKQMRPGLGLVGLDMANEAFLYYAYELGKDRARADWELYYPAIRQAYIMDKSKHAKELEEGWESGPEEYQEPYDDADDAYDRQRQEKIDTEAEKEWAKLPKVSTYKLVGRGPNMEPNYAFGDTEYDTLEQAIEARKQLMADPETPHPEHIGIQTLTRVVNKEQTDEAIDSDIVQPMGQDTFNRAGFNPLRDERDYLDRLSGLSNLYRKPGLDPSMKAEIFQRINDLNAEARKKGYIQAESRGHKTIATKLGNIERSKNFRVPSPEERRELAQRMKDFEAQLKSAKSKKQKVDELLNTTPYGQPAQDPKQAASVAQATQTIKAATGSAAPTTNIAKAIDAASQGKPVGQADMKVLEPVMKDVATIAQDPKLASQFKTLAQQVNQTQLKQQQLAKK